MAEDEADQETLLMDMKLDRGLLTYLQCSYLLLAVRNQPAVRQAVDSLLQARDIPLSRLESEARQLVELSESGQRGILSSKLIA